MPYIDRNKVFSKADILTVHTREYGSIEVVPVEYLADLPIADVVPRSEVEQLQKKLVVQKRCNNELVKICEKLNKDLAEFENKQFSCDSCDRIALTSAEHKHCIEQAKQEVVRKIFEDFTKHKVCTNEEDYRVLAELKKKYIGE